MGGLGIYGIISDYSQIRRAELYSSGCGSSNSSNHLSRNIFCCKSFDILCFCKSMGMKGSFSKKIGYISSSRIEKEIMKKARIEKIVAIITPMDSDHVPKKTLRMCVCKRDYSNEVRKITHFGVENARESGGNCASRFIFYSIKP